MKKKNPAEKKESKETECDAPRYDESSYRENISDDKHVK